jgi:peptidoglycan lytic transglycosylase
MKANVVICCAIAGTFLASTSVFASAAQRHSRAHAHVHAHTARVTSQAGEHSDTSAHEAFQAGIASVYSNEKTANGEYASPGRLTAAHKTLPFGTMVRVTSKENGRSVVVRINDRGPYVKGRVIDLMPAAAHALGFSGLAHVSLAVVGRS